MIIAQRKFVIDSPRERIWELILRAVMRLMPFEKMEIKNPRSFGALLKVKIGPITLSMQAQGDIVDIVPPESVVTVLKARGMGGLVWLNQRAIFTLTPVAEGKTEINCEVADEGMAPLLRTLLSWKVKSFTEEAFKGLEERLRQWA